MYKQIMNLRCELVDHIPMPVFHKTVHVGLRVSKVTHVLANHLVARLGLLLRPKR